jgi:hypothetical protein
MDPITPSASPSTPGEERSSRVSLGKLWQVPVFFVGVVAVLTACLTRGLVAPDPVRQLHRDLAEARRFLDRQTLDPEAALQHAQQAVDNLMYDQGQAGEAFFLLGTAHLRLADQPGATSSDEHYGEAQRLLQEAERRGLTGEDAHRLHYQLAKVSFHLHDNPDQVIEQLKANLDFADDRAEAMTLLYQSYLRKTPPDYKAALQINKKLREEVPQISEDVLGPAKLAGAKLLLQLNQHDEARKTLEKINDQAPPATLSEKNMLLAGLYQEEHKWNEAATLWRAVREEKRVPLTEAGGVLYNLGVCYRQLEQYGPAAEAWSDCMQRSRGEEVQAAALALAELRLHETGSNPEKGVALLAEAVAKIRKADDWKNSLLNLANVRDLFEQSITIYREAQRFDLAVRTAELYERVASPPKAQVRRAELNTAWARVVQERARSAKEEAARNKEETTADELLRQAAQAHAEAAKLLDAKDQSDEHLWQSAVCSFQGHDYPRAAEKLKDIVEQVKDNVERLSEGLFLLGETCRHLNEMQAAETAYKACVERGARFTYRARYQLALIDIEAGNIDRARYELEQNILIEHRDSDPEAQEAQEKSRLALCSLLYQSATSLPPNYRRVVQYLEKHLDHFAVTPEAVRARYQLADSYRQIASNNQINHSARSEKISLDVENHHREVNRHSWTRAAEEFTKLEEIIQDSALASLLSLKQQVEIPFFAAECYFNLGEYEKALHEYERLAEKWGRRQHALRAMGETIKCFAAMKDYKQIQQRADSIRGMLATTEGLTDADRQRWIEWLKIVTATPPSAERESHDDDRPKIIIKSHAEPRAVPEQGGPSIDIKPERP